MIELFEFQRRAADQIAVRCVDYLAGPVVIEARGNRRVIPFFQALDAITASGKTVILAEATNSIRASLPIAPLVLWLSKGKVVVDQTYANLTPGGKYHHLLPGFDIKALAEYDVTDVASTTVPIVYIATVGTFNQRDKERGTLLIHKSDIEDTANESIWDSLSSRLDEDGRRRPLIIVYDEAQNLTDLQTDLLLELEPEIFLAASATMKIPRHLADEMHTLKVQGSYSDEELVTHVDAKAVAESGLVKDTLVLAGYRTPMEEAVSELLSDLEQAEADTSLCDIGGHPKAIYVCKTNIVESDAFQRDDPKRHFDQRQAPPILIWRYLVSQGVPPDDIAVYCALTFDKSFPPPAEFRHFKGGDNDYEAFIAGDFHHVIFNLSLQEGWDDPLCYFAYVDKSMDSAVAVEQLIGRVLRQPNARHYTAERLNTAHFYVRVDRNDVFTRMLESVGRKLAAEAPSTLLIASAPGRSRPTEVRPKKTAEIPGTALDSTSAVHPVQRLLDRFPDFRFDPGPNVESQGTRSIVRAIVGDDVVTDVEWERFNLSHAVTIRWLFIREVRRQYPRALEVVDVSTEKFDAKVGMGSIAHAQTNDLATEIVDAYLDNVNLVQKKVDPYTVGPILVREDEMESFRYALHTGYSGLNGPELEFANELNKLRMPWVRNPARGSGYGIPLVSRGPSQTFYPDFLVWNGDDIYAIDPKGGHILHEAAARKLLSIRQPRGSSVALHVRLISEGTWSEDVERQSPDGYTLWSTKADSSRRVTHFEGLPELVRHSVGITH